MLACLLIEHLPVRVELHRNPRLQGRPVILAGLSGSHRVVLDASPKAAGVSPGMPLAEALSRCRDSVLVEPDPTAYRHAFEEALASVEALGADVEEATLGTAYVRLSGLELLYGGLEGVLTAVAGAVPAYLAPRIGAARSKFTARVVAREARSGTYRLAPSDLVSFLAPLPVELLPVAWETRARLESFGLHTLGQIAELPLGAIQAQLGRTGRVAWELAQGIIDPQPLVPRLHETRIEAALTFPNPVATIEPIATSAASLLARAFA